MTSPSDDITLHCIMERVKPGNRPSSFKLYACRDDTTECLGNRRRSRHCDRCVEGRSNETLEELVERLVPHDH